MKKREDLLKEIKKKVAIRDVITSRLGPDERSWLCPFHGDKQAGSLKAWDQKNKFRCFSCGKNGDAVDFVMQTDHIPMGEAIYKLSVEYNLITPEEYKKITKKVFSGKQRNSKSVEATTDKAPLKDPETIDFVYSTICQESSLSAEHRAYLNGRGIGDYEISRFGYFSMPSREIIPVLQRKLENMGMTKEDLLGVPGFYQWKKTGKIDMPCYEGIGIPIRDLSGSIVALQIRRDNAKKGESRYLYFSSTFANNPARAKYLHMGCGPQHTAGFLPGRAANSHGVLITEGFFKAAQWVMLKEKPAITIQGVNNTKDVLPMLEAGFPKSTNVVFAFDMDMEVNENVARAAEKLNSRVKEAGYPTYFMKWNPEDGKGLDDLILNGKQDTIKVIKG